MSSENPFKRTVVPNEDARRLRPDELPTEELKPLERRPVVQEADLRDLSDEEFKLQKDSAGARVAETEPWREDAGEEWDLLRSKLHGKISAYLEEKGDGLSPELKRGIMIVRQNAMNVITDEEGLSLMERQGFTSQAAGIRHLHAEGVITSEDMDEGERVRALNKSTESEFNRRNSEAGRHDIEQKRRDQGAESWDDVMHT